MSSNDSNNDPKTPPKAAHSKKNAEQNRQAIEKALANDLALSSETSSAPRCAFADDCDLLGPPRRMVSHYFGRNKKGTRAIPKEVWICYCRQHYQRVRYNQPIYEYAQLQMDLVRQTVEKLEKRGGVTDFTIQLRKRELEEATEKATEHWLFHFTGPHKSFTEVYDVIDLVAERSRAKECPAPEFELIPNIAVSESER
jgi:hypothetical protein